MFQIAWTTPPGWSDSPSVSHEITQYCRARLHPHAEKIPRAIQKIVYIDIREDGKQIMTFVFVLGARYRWNHGNQGQHSDRMLASINLFLISKQSLIWEP